MVGASAVGVNSISQTLQFQSTIALVRTWDESSGRNGIVNMLEGAIEYYMFLFVQALNNYTLH